ncbi:MAG: PSD1 and planctomycete cytochrome C domain-containing protein [Saprospiraceae bacterium]|nr:PSD1 and planctomycete cytochrome C domain-containing protein [Saprospiraceae bacterium]
MITMRSSFAVAAVLVLFGFFLLGSCEGGVKKISAEDPRHFFVFEVLPIIRSKCLSCHGEQADKLEGNLDLRSAAGVGAGGDRYHELIVNGRPEFSPLYLAVSRQDPDFAMPPKEGDALTDEEKQAFYSWIVAGAPWPDKQEEKQILANQSGRQASRIRVKTSGGQSDQWDNRFYRPQDLWAYQARRLPEFPAGLQVENPIDAFINAKLKAAGIEYASKANSEVLIKRTYYDLLGMPPTYDQLQRHLETNQTFEEVVDELLESPFYGEQWARHWLDVVRYSDSDGFSNDHARPNAWRYRDYVIRSFNDDKPYDQFVIEQIAGDELPNPYPDQIIATGFLRMGPWEHTAMSVAAETRQFFLDDVTNIVGEAFLAVPLNCAKCHDHKYDPIPTRDYYKIQAVFANTQLAQRAVPFLPEENLAFMDEERERVVRWIRRAESLQDSIRQKEEFAANKWYKERGRTYLPKRQRRKLDESKHPPRYYGLSFADLGQYKVAQKREQLEKRNLDRFGPWAYSVYNGPDRVVNSHSSMRMPVNTKGDPVNTYILNGGSLQSKGETVAPGVLSILHHQDSLHTGDFAFQSRIPSALNGRRIAFARWLVHPDNPITARVMVNRIWQYHFGYGLARNPNNFGASGENPTHPELLDWLSNKFIESGWSVKAIHRMILTSETYQRQSDHSMLAKLDEVDPDNRLLSYFPLRRLDAEEIRDAMLLISGELNSDVGGIPIRPEIPLEVALQPRHTMGSTAPAYQPSWSSVQRNRRSIYIERKRSIENPFLQTFNQNDSNLSCEKRDESTVVTQSFALLNSPATRSRALHLADRITKKNQNLETWIEEAYRSILLRNPTNREMKRSIEFFRAATNEHERQKPRVAYPRYVEHEMFEEMTGETFTYTEYLDVYDDYQADLTDDQASQDCRALADLVTILFNTNEFLYVY